MKFREDGMIEFQTRRREELRRNPRDVATGARKANDNLTVSMRTAPMFFKRYPSKSDFKP